MTTTSYADRDAILKRMGFRSYAAYLESDLWKGIRARAWHLHGGNCVVCRKAASAIHHYSYDENTLQGGDLSQLFPICDRCHKKVEFTKKGQKRTLEQAQQVFLQLRGHPPIKTKQLPKKQRLTRIRLPSRKQRRATPEGCRQLMMEKKEQIKAKIAQLQAELAELEKW